MNIHSCRIEGKPDYGPNFLLQQLDLEVLARQTQYVDHIVQTELFASLIKFEILAHAVELSDVNTTKGIVKERVFTCFHPSGTCAMMPAEMGGVVDDRLKGTQNKKPTSCRCHRFAFRTIRKYSSYYIRRG